MKMDADYLRFLSTSFANVHSSWHPVLECAIHALVQAEPHYLQELSLTEYLPTQNRLFAAFAQPLDKVRYILIGEGPYPRPQSATGLCFMDGAVTSLWSEQGLSKAVNRATSLRNFIKMLLVADGQLALANTRGDAMREIAQYAHCQPDEMIQQLHDLQSNLLAQGFLLLNACLVFRTNVAPAKEAKAWQPFIQTVLQGLRDTVEALPTLVLWGKIAQQFCSDPVAACFPQAVSEHPYNLSFIGNTTMQELFRPMHLLRRVV